ncbi:MAG TPA: hypothetical protein VFH55_04750 [Nitrospiria bacterium]|nr:hypothetical protein [Nitrospiria bacterium]
MDNNLLEFDDVYLIAYLQAKGYSYTGLKQSGRFVSFQFNPADRVKINQSALEYRAGGMVSARIYAESIKEIKKVISKTLRAEGSQVRR